MHYFFEVWDDTETHKLKGYLKFMNITDEEIINEAEIQLNLIVESRNNFFLKS